MKNFSITLLSLLLVLVLSACSSSPIPASTLPNIAGTWASPNKESGYVITQNGSQLSGKAYWYLQGDQRLVGFLSGSIEAGGKAQWTTVLSENGSTGKETIQGTFSANNFVGGFKIFNPDGTLRQEGQQTLVR